MVVVIIVVVVVVHRHPPPLPERGWPRGPYAEKCIVW